MLWRRPSQLCQVRTSLYLGCGYGKECSATSPVRGICPKGWHLPSDDEWEVLLSAAGGADVAGKKLNSASGWEEYEGERGNGEDAFGFSSRPAGYRNYNGDYFWGGYNAYFWSSTEYNSYAYYMNLLYSGNAVLDRNEDKNDEFSVRCLKD